MYRILAINPGSTSTKIACYRDEKVIFEKSVPFADHERAEFKNVIGQLDRRFELVKSVLAQWGEEEKFDAVSARGGLLSPMESGTYFVNEEMKKYLIKAPRGEHASNLGAFLAERFANEWGCPAFIVNPVAVDELSAVARISGAPEIERISLVHALNQKAVARKVADKIGKRYGECSFVIAHLGTGITIGAHLHGRIVDVIGAKADGPFSPERAGALPVDMLTELCYSGKYSYEELKKKLLSGWGLVAYLGTRDIREAFKMAESDPQAKTVTEAMAYQIAKGIGELAAALDGHLDAVILTGGLAYSEPLMQMVTKKIKFLGRVEIIPGENELEALALGALRVLRKEEQAKEYLSC